MNNNVNIYGNYTSYGSTYLNNKNSHSNLNTNSNANITGERPKTSTNIKIKPIQKVSSMNFPSSINNKTNRGRKKKDVIEKGNHTKFTDDNMMRKIKCHFLNHL